MRQWWDPETVAILSRSISTRDAPTSSTGFSLILLQRSPLLPPLARALGRILTNVGAQAGAVLHDRCPVLVRSGMSFEEALRGRFELICADAVAILLDDAALDESHRGELQDVLERVLNNDEFTPVSVRIHSLPATEDGIEFLDQFLSSGDSPVAGDASGLNTRVARIKAELLLHWGGRVGAVVSRAEAGDDVATPDAVGSATPNG